MPSSDELEDDLRCLLKDVLEPPREDSRLPIVDSETTRAICKLILQKGSPIPSSLRPAVWMVLLKCYGKDVGSFEDWMQSLRSPDHIVDGDPDTGTGVFAFRKRRDTDSVLKAADSTDWIRVLRCDLSRTRTDSDLFKGNVRMHADMELILTYYCISRNVAYKQGLNEMLAPLLVLRSNSGLDPSFALTYLSFYAIINKFLPSIYDDDRFESLQVILRLFQKLLLYHDPVLCAFLDQHDLIPELYAIPWFITMFARNLPLDLVFSLWDLYIINDDPFLHYWVALAILMHSKKDLMGNADLFTLPGKVGNMQSYLDSIETVSNCVKKALELRSETPVSFRRLLFDISFKEDTFNGIDDGPCLIVTPDEIMQKHHQNLDCETISYIILDCRSEQEFNAGHLCKAIHVDLIEQLEDLKGLHLCVMGDGVDSETELEVISQLMKRKFPFLSWCKGGYRQCHRVSTEETVLVEHNRLKCLECTPEEFGQPLGRSLMTGISAVLQEIRSGRDALIKEFKTETVAVFKLKAFVKQCKGKSFKALEMIDSKGKTTLPCILVVSPYELFILNPTDDFKQSNECSMGRVYDLKNLSRITSKGKAVDATGEPKCVSFYWKTLEKCSFFVVNAQECIKKTKEVFSALLFRKEDL